MPRYSSAASITSPCINSIAVGTDFDLIILGTVSIAFSNSLNGTSKLMDFLGSGNNFNVALVIIPNVPSDPIIKSLILYPELFLTTFPPRFRISPFGVTTSNPLT